MHIALNNTFQIFRFKIQYAPKIYRIIDIKGTDDLYTFAEVIIDSFDFDFDHAFGFYSNLVPYSGGEESYELFVDLDPTTETHTKKSLGVKNQLIQNVFFLDKNMLFLFDYGEDWLFLVTCIQITAYEEKREFVPLIVQDLNKGKAPRQYT